MAPTLGNEKGKRRIGSVPDKDAVLTTGTVLILPTVTSTPVRAPKRVKCAYYFVINFFGPALRDCFFFLFLMLLSFFLDLD